MQIAQIDNLKTFTDKTMLCEEGMKNLQKEIAGKTAENVKLQKEIEEKNEIIKKLKG
jgi:hypothetical protein